jgi:formate dehydrogenase major subunit
MIKNLLSKWPVYQQIKNRSNGNGSESWSERTRTLQPKTAGADVARSVCPYCAVGCGQMIYHKEGKLISIEGDPHSPISRGHLCPKGANTFQLHTAPSRIEKVKYRRPYGTEWEELPLDQAMDMIADRLWESRDSSFVESKEGETVMNTTKVAHVGGATLDNEENYLIKKLFSGGLGLVCVSNQARI